MAEVKTKLGYVPCKHCTTTREVAVLENSQGTLSFKCDECGTSGFVKKGEHGHAALLEVLKVKTLPEPKPGDIKPAPRAGFSLGGLSGAKA